MLGRCSIAPIGWPAPRSFFFCFETVAGCLFDHPEPRGPLLLPVCFAAPRALGSRGAPISG
ncbi:unnamed protein product [Amoebophrya sp. A120]|nr:unnamed protein product [Amoebophrya sp. A120]|eukprot:GSA120T00009605001.1